MYIEFLRMIPEGITTFKIVSINDTKYEESGELSIKMITQDGNPYTETFRLRKSDTEINEGAVRAWEFFAKTAIGDMTLDGIDTQDIVGKYITATVVHEEFDYKRGVKTGQKGVAVRLKDWKHATCFPAMEANETKSDYEIFDDTTITESTRMTPEEIDAFLA